MPVRFVVLRNWCSGGFSQVLACGAPHGVACCVRAVCAPRSSHDVCGRTRQWPPKTRHAQRNAHTTRTTQHAHDTPMDLQTAGHCLGHTDTCRQPVPRAGRTPLDRDAPRARLSRRADSLAVRGLRGPTLTPPHLQHRATCRRTSSSLTGPSAARQAGPTRASGTGATRACSPKAHEPPGHGRGRERGKRGVNSALSVGRPLDFSGPPPRTPAPRGVQRIARVNKQTTSNQPPPTNDSTTAFTCSPGHPGAHGGGEAHPARRPRTHPGPHPRRRRPAKERRNGMQNGWEFSLISSTHLHVIPMGCCTAYVQMSKRTRTDRHPCTIGRLASGRNLTKSEWTALVAKPSSGPPRRGGREAATPTWCAGSST